MSDARTLPSDVERRSAATSWSRSCLVALTVAVTLPSLRMVLPHLYDLKETASLGAVVLVAVGVAASPLLVVPLRRFLGYESALISAVTVLAGWRLLVQVADGASMVAAVLGAVAGLAALALLLSEAEDEAVALGTGVLGGLALDALVLGSFGTWDAVWQHGLDPVVLAVLEAGGLALALAAHVRSVRGSAPAARMPLGGGLAMGGVLGLEVLFLADPGYVAAASDRSLALAMLTVGLGLAAAVAALALARPERHAPAVVAALVLAGAGFLLPELRGSGVVVVVVGAQAAAGVVLARALAPARASEATSEVAASLGLALALVSVLLFQIHFDLPLPVDNRWIPTALGALGLLATVGRRSADRTRAAGLGLRVAAAVGVAAVAVAVGVGATAPSPSAAAVPSSFRLVQWNVRQGVGEGGVLDPEAIAGALEAQHADVVVLNEVARGWPISGQLDLASWLARRLDLHAAWAGAASAQFGNLVLSRYPILDAQVLDLPVAGDAQGRSALVATLATADGAPVRVIATHLQHRNDGASRTARMAEIDQLLTVWGGGERTVLAGDLNPRQGDPPLPARVPSGFEEISAILAGGLTTTGELDGCTRPTSGRNCSDYVFVSPDLRQGALVVADAFGDHHLLVTDVSLG